MTSCKVSVFCLALAAAIPPPSFERSYVPKVGMIRQYQGFRVPSRHWGGAVRALSDGVQKQMRALQKKKRARGPVTEPAVTPVTEPAVTPVRKGGGGEEDPRGGTVDIPTMEQLEQTPTELPLICVIGSSGGVGRATVKALKSSGRFRVRAVVRDKFGPSSVGIRKYLDANDDIVEADVTKPSTLRTALNGAKAIIFAAGAGIGGASSETPGDSSDGESLEIPGFGRIPVGIPGLPDPGRVVDAVLMGGFEKVDNRGVANVAAVSAGLEVPPERIILISSIGVTRALIVQLAGLAGDVLAQKRKGEVALSSSGLSYTILRPGGLLNAPGISRGAMGLRLSQGDTDLGSISRDDVATCCVEILKRPHTARDTTFELVGDASGMGDDQWVQALEGLKPDVEVKNPIEEIFGFNPLDPTSVAERLLGDFQGRN